MNYNCASQRQLDTHIQPVHLVSQLDHNEVSENPHLFHLMAPSPVFHRLRLLAVSSEVWDGVNFPSPFITQPLCYSTRGDYSTAVPHSVDPLQCKKENSVDVRLVIGRILVVHPKCKRCQINIRVSDHNRLCPQPQWNGKYFLLDSLELHSSFYTTAFCNLSCTVAGREFTLGTIRLYYFYSKATQKGEFISRVEASLRFQSNLPALNGFALQGPKKMKCFSRNMRLSRLLLTGIH